MNVLVRQPVRHIVIDWQPVQVSSHSVGKDSIYSVQDKAGIEKNDSDLIASVWHQHSA